MAGNKHTLRADFCKEIRKSPLEVSVNLKDIIDIPAKSKIHSKIKVPLSSKEDLILTHFLLTVYLAVLAFR